MHDVKKKYLQLQEFLLFTFLFTKKDSDTSYCKAYSFLFALSFKGPVKKNRGCYQVIVVYNQTKLFVQKKMLLRK